MVGTAHPTKEAVPLRRILVQNEPNFTPADTGWVSENALQRHYEPEIVQNKPNLGKGGMNVNLLL